MTSATSTVSSTEHDAPLLPIVASQLESLDDTDALASAWTDAVAEAGSEPASWGGRGRGGRGLARNTYQPRDVSVDAVDLEFVGDPSATAGGGSKVLLEGAQLKLLPGRVYAVVGRNGCGKSTLLRRIDAGRVPGFPNHIPTMYVPQEVFGGDENAVEIVLRHQRKLEEVTAEVNAARIRELEEELDALDVGGGEVEQARIEDLCEQMSRIEGHDDVDGNGDSSWSGAEEALGFFGVPPEVLGTPTSRLSGGLRKKISLACALFYRPQLLLLDEPTNHLDIRGMVQLRRLIADCVADRSATVVIVSHDVDLINDVTTDVIHFHGRGLSYYPGNYRDFLGYREQGIAHATRQADRLGRQRAAMMSTIDNLKGRAASSKSTADKKKVQKQIDSRRKKLERHGIEKDERGHRWTAQKACTGIRKGSINSVDAGSRAKLSHRELLKRGETSVKPVPDKAVQFDFRSTTCTWGEPLVTLMEVGHGYEPIDKGEEVGFHLKRAGMLFDCVDLCINEGSRTCILGANNSGKSTLLRIIAGNEQPREGTVHRAHGLGVAYFSQHIADNLVKGVAKDGTSAEMVTALSLLANLFPTKSEQDLRGELTSFGLSPVQAATNVKFLSGGERCRLCLASLMLEDPQLLILDEVTNHLDAESVEALTFGIKKWNGTAVFVTHDANLIRSINGFCYVLMEKEGKLMRIPNGIDSYLKVFQL